MTISFKSTNDVVYNPNKSTNYDKNLPIKTGLLGAVTIGTIGLGCDYLVVNKLLKIKTSKKENLIINGLLGLFAGIYTFFKTNKLQKEGKIKNIDDFTEYFTNDKS